MLCERRWVKESVSMTGLISLSARSIAAGRTKPSRLNIPALARSVRHRSTSPCHSGEPGLSSGKRSRSRMSRMGPLSQGLLTRYVRPGIRISQDKQKLCSLRKAGSGAPRLRVQAQLSSPRSRPPGTGSLMESDRLRLSPKAARSLIFGALTGAGTLPKNAGYFADAILDTELSGLAGHGFYWLQYYCEHV